MAADNSYSFRSPAVKRLMKEAQELKNATDQYFTQPLEDNLFEWHFTVRGPADTDFAGGVYHGRIVLPPEYPMKPPSILWMTPNGRFEVNKKICLSISGHHPESWQPSWSIRTALLAIMGFMPTHGNGAIGSLDYPAEERQKLAKKSVQWSCPKCGDNILHLLKPVIEGPSQSSVDAAEIKRLAGQIQFTATAGATSETTSPAASETASSGLEQPPAAEPTPAAASSSSEQPAPGPVPQYPGVAGQFSPYTAQGDVPFNPFTVPPAWAMMWYRQQQQQMAMVNYMQQMQRWQQMEFIRQQTQQNFVAAPAPTAAAPAAPVRRQLAHGPVSTALLMALVGLFVALIILRRVMLMDEIFEFDDLRQG